METLTNFFIGSVCISIILCVYISFADWFTSRKKKPQTLSDDIRIFEKPNQTIGEQRVRTAFNPSKTETVDLIKQKTAELINLCEELKAKDERLAFLAQTLYEEAAMWAVKVATA